MQPFKQSAKADHSLRLIRTAERLPPPENYFLGRAPLAQALPLNILLFLRKTQRELQRRNFASLPHHRMVLIVPLSISGTVHIDNLALHIHPGQAALVFPFQFHHYSDLEQEHLRWLFLSFESSEPENLHLLRDRVLPIDHKCRQEIEYILHAFPISDRADILQLRTGLLLQYLEASVKRADNANQATPSKTPVTSRHGILLQRINAVMHGSDLSPTIAEIAKKLNISEGHLRQQFRDNFGLPLGNYLRRRRLTRMHALLNRSDLNLTEIAFECGYRSLPAFSRAFRQMTGIAPSHYRAQQRIQ